MWYVLVMLFIVRPLSIGLSTIGTELTSREKLLIGWIAPRGIVALTVSGYFATILLDHGYEDAKILTALTFALVFTTVLVHGFSIGPLARKLNLQTTDESGVLIVGGSRFAAELAISIKSTGNEVLIVDQTWAGLSHSRKVGLNGFVGDILSEQLDYHLDLTPYRFILAMTSLDTYNAHVCEDFVPDLGRDFLFQTAGIEMNVEKNYKVTGGRMLFSPAVSIYELEDRMSEGHVIRKTLITKYYSYTQYLRERDDTSILLYILRTDGSIEFYSPKIELKAEAGDTVIALVFPTKTIERVKERLEDVTIETEIQYQKVEELFSNEMKTEKSFIPGKAPISAN